jgi:hypothetical protein
MTTAPPFQSFGPGPDPFAPAQETAKDEKYLRHEFTTWQGWTDFSKGWTPQEAREAVEAHIKGWPYMSASLARHLPRLALILGALTQRTAPPLRTTWRQEASRGPKYAITDLGEIWKRQWRPGYEEKLRDMAILGGSVMHVHWVPDIASGFERPVLKRWPHEAMFWRAASPAFAGGWYALTADSGLVRMTPGDGHWIFLAHGERWHEFGAILALGELFVAGKLAERDEAGLSEAAGRASPVAELPEGFKIEDEIGKSVQKMVAGLGRARTGAVIPHGTKLDGFEISSDTSFFDRYGGRQLLKVALAILGQSTSLSPGANGVYQPIASWSVADALNDKDHEATTRGWDEGLVRPYLDLNAITSDVHLVGERYADAGAKATAEGARATLLASTVKAQRDAGLAPTQTDVNDLARRLSTPTLLLASSNTPPPPPAGGTAPAGSTGAPVVAAAADGKALSEYYALVDSAKKSGFIVDDTFTAKLAASLGLPAPPALAKDTSSVDVYAYDLAGGLLTRGTAADLKGLPVPPFPEETVPEYLARFTSGAAPGAPGDPAAVPPITTPVD